MEFVELASWDYFPVAFVKAIIRAQLNSRHPGSPTWEGRKPQPVAVNLRDAWVKRLVRKTEACPFVPLLQTVQATQLESCNRKRPCGSGACPICGSTFQRWTVDQIVSGYGNAANRFAASIVMPAATARKGHLAAIDLPSLLEEVKTVLANTGIIRNAAVALDFSFNDYSQRGETNRWQVQAYVIGTTTTNIKVLSRTLSKAWPKTKLVPRPVRVRIYDGSAYGASYLFKWEFVHRVSYQGDNGRWNTKKRRLQADEHIELMIVLASIGLTGRFAVTASPNSGSTEGT